MMHFSRSIKNLDFETAIVVIGVGFAEHNQAFVYIKTATQLEKSRYVIFAMQTDRKNVMSEDINLFNCKLTNVKLDLNSECYPGTMT